jgi:hypothetical protein
LLAHQIGDAARIITIVLVAETGLQCGCRVPCIDADHRPAIPLQRGKQPSCGTIRFQADTLDGKPGSGDKACDNIGAGWKLGLAHDMQSAFSFEETSMPTE